MVFLREHSHEHAYDALTNPASLQDSTLENYNFMNSIVIFNSTSEHLALNFSSDASLTLEPTISPTAISHNDVKEIFSLNFTDTTQPTSEPTMLSTGLEPLNINYTNPFPTGLPTPNVGSGHITSYPTLEPSGFPSPFSPSIYNSTSSSHTNKYAFTSASDTALAIIVSCVLLSWIVMAVIAYRRHKIRNNPADEGRHGLLETVNQVRQKKKSKKFEDYWDEESDESGISRRNAAKRLEMNTEDWDRNIDLSTSSIVSFNSAKDPRFN
eukprot:gene3154-6206_t